MATSVLNKVMLMKCSDKCELDKAETNKKTNQ